MPAEIGFPYSRPLAAEYDVALVDLDGVVYSGTHQVPGAAAALAAAQEKLGQEVTPIDDMRSSAK